MGLIVRNLSCVRGGRRVFDDVSFALSPGEGLLVTGPNGAGKTSLLRLLAGLSRPAAGEISFDAESISNPSPQPSPPRGEGAKQHVDIPLAERSHFVGHLNAVKSALTVAENAHFAARYLGGGEARVEAALKRLGLSHLADLPAGILSAGQKRRVALTRLATVERLLWLLDEPTVSLDATSASVLAEMIGEHLAAGGMAVVATHAPVGIELAHRLELGAAA